MEFVDPPTVEFLDLTGVEENEKNWILTSLQTRDSTVRGPWKPLAPKLTSQIQGNTYQTNHQLDYNASYDEPQKGAALPNSQIYQQQYVTTPQYIEQPSVQYLNNEHEQNHSEIIEENGDLQNGDSQKNSSRSWASLFNKSGTGDAIEAKIEFVDQPLSEIKNNGVIINDTVINENICPIKFPKRSDFDDPTYYRMGEYLITHNVDHKIISLQPRGLINRSNYCYINSILQALLACPPVYNLLIGLAENVTEKEKKKNTQIIDNMAKFVKEFHHLPATQRVGRRNEKNAKKEPQVSITCDTPFEPNWIYKMLNGIRSDTFVFEGRQEDAEEFLGCLLNGLNDEMLDLIKLVDNGVMKTPQATDKEDKEWQVMGPKNKGCVTRRTEVTKTPISDIFGGHLRSRVHRTGDQITDNIEPFFTLPLNIEKVLSVREALDALVNKTQLEGLTSSKTNQEVEAWQQVTIEELPIVLILHLKCFDFKTDGCTKIIKNIEFPIDLKIEQKLLSSKANYSSKERQYKLFAVVYHDGKEATAGHYVTDAYHVGYASWLHYDDAAVKAVSEESVLKPHGTRVPYLLFYRRTDSIRATK